MLKLPAVSINQTETTSCTTEYGRTYYLNIQFAILAILIGTQVGRMGGDVAH